MNTEREQNPSKRTRVDIRRKEGGENIRQLRVGGDFGRIFLHL